VKTVDANERLDRIEAELAAAKLPIERRVDDLEAKLKKFEPKKRDFWDKAQAISGIIVALVTALVGYLLTGSVNLALERRKLETANVEKMRDLITKFNSPEISAGDAEALGLTIGAFGEFAVPSLVAALGTPTINRATGARTGLLAASLNREDRDVVCTTLTDVVSNRTQRYAVLMKLRAVELLGILECRREADQALRDFLTLVTAASQPGGIEKLASVLDERQPVGQTEVSELRFKLCATAQLRNDLACSKAGIK
jgi:hypothetical protein